DLLGKIGNLEKSDAIIKSAIEKISSGEVEASRITKTVLVIDEAQDIDADEFDLINALIERNEEMRVIAVGDDDQNIYEFRGASARYLKEFIKKMNAIKEELVENYRSKNNLVEFTNCFVSRIHDRLKNAPIVAKQRDNGKIKIVQYQSTNLISPLVKEIVSSSLTGTTCVLTRRNDEALQVTGLLLKQGIQAKLIQSNDRFSLYNLAEIRYFLRELNSSDDVYTISNDVWEKAKNGLWNKFRASSKLELCKNIIRDFEDANTKKKYKTDFEVFVRESRLEDFYGSNGDTIFVSTFHKAKGREFDNVFIMLADFLVATDEESRLLYVAMTRAKQNLSIHLNENCLNGITVDNLERIEDFGLHFVPSRLAVQMTHQHVQLWYFERVQQNMLSIYSGDILAITDVGFKDQKGNLVLKFSKRFLDLIDTHTNMGYKLKHAKVNFVVYWKSENSEKEVIIILPEAYFEKDIS
ncbi:MAG TPA: 3'-5' exonuclease, partial [Puia sp.]|nr:3'-5' exonuclease [Puia sp.]